MRTTVLAICACALGGAPRALLPQTTAADSIAVIQAVRQFHDALARRDSAAALALLADDAVVLEGGSIESRAEYRRHHLPADMQFAADVPAKRGPLQVVLAGDVAWVISTSEAAGTSGGRPVTSAGAELVVLTRAAKGWQIRAIHWSSRRRATP